jgi:hypothetical protein
MSVGPQYSQPPRFNHVAMSMPADALDDEGRKAICDFYGDVFGFEEYPDLTTDRKQLVLRAHTHEQFVFLIADEPNMACARLDHFGMSVATKDDFDELYRRASAWREREPEQVDLIDPAVDEYPGLLKLHNFYVRYRLPLMVETQHFEWLT